MDDTLDLINRLANERHMLYRMVGNGRNSPEIQDRIRTISDQLPLLWDRHRRELAAGRRYTPSGLERRSA